MIDNTHICTTTAAAARLIEIEMGLEPGKALDIIERYMEMVVECLEAERQHSIKGFGKFYHHYAKRGGDLNAGVDPYYKDKILKGLGFKLMGIHKKRLTGYVKDLGIKNNDAKNLARVAILPEELTKIRRKQILDDQLSVGFRAELLFDEDNLSQHDKEVAASLGEQPTVEEILKRVGANIAKD